MIAAHGVDPPDDETWDRMVEASVELYHTYQFGRMLATSKGGAPTSSQRHRFDLRVREVVKKTGVLRARVALMSDSAFARAVISISTLFEEGWHALATRGQRNVTEGSGMYRAFSPSELPQAIAWLQVEPGKEVVILRELERLKKEVG